MEWPLTSGASHVKLATKTSPGRAPVGSFALAFAVDHSRYSSIHSRSGPCNPCWLSLSSAYAQRASSVGKAVRSFRQCSVSFVRRGYRKRTNLKRKADPCNGAWDLVEVMLLRFGVEELSKWIATLVRVVEDVLNACCHEVVPVFFMFFFEIFEIGRGMKSRQLSM